MGELDLEILLHIITFLAFPFIGGYFAMRLKLPSLFGYIVGGVVMGFFIEKTISANLLSQFAGLGILFLFFTVGLEMNLENLRKLKKFAFFGGALQIVLCAFFIFLLCLAFRFSFAEAILIGFAFALSSTAVVAKIIQERGEENSLIGALSLGVLVFQDLAAIPILIILSGFSPEKTGLSFVSNLFFGVAKAGVILFLIYFLGQKIVPVIFKKTAAVSRELLNLFTILFIFSIAGLFSYLGLSATIAAFLAGVLVGQTMVHYHIFSQVRPLRDLFTILFFAYLGSSINLSTVVAKLPLILLFTLMIIFIKAALILLLFIKFKFHSRTSFSIAIILSQVGEFAFILLSQAFFLRIISQETYYFTVTSVLLTIALTPVLITHMDDVYMTIRKFIKTKLPDLQGYLVANVDRQPPHIDVLPLKNHVIICGFGRVGKYVGRALSMAQIPYVAIDYNLITVDEARGENIPIIYGDPTDIDILDYAQAETAVCLVSAVPGLSSQEMIILNAKKLNSKIIIFSRANQDKHQERLKDLGAHVIIQPEFEASLAIIKRVFVAFDISKEDMIGKIKRLRIEHGME